MDALRQDIYDLFDRKRGGHVQHWLYSDHMRKMMTGSELWGAFYRAARDYYIPRIETELIRTKGRNLISVNKYDLVADFGVGIGALYDKVLPLIDGTSISHYAGIDISEDMLVKVREIMKKKRPGIHVETHNVDFHSENDYIALGGSKRLGLLLGSSISNQEMMEAQGLPREQIVSQLKDFKRHLGPEGDMLMSYDSNPDERKVRSAYSNPYWSQHVTGLMYDVARELKTGGDFDPEAWHHEMYWDPNAHVVHQCIVADRAQTLETEDRSFHFNQWSRYVAVNNFKYPVPLFNELCEEAGYKIGNRESLEPMELQLLAAA